MKVFWCTRYKNNKGKFHGEELLLDKVSSATLRQIDKVYDEEKAYKLKHVDLPNAIVILKIFFLFTATLLMFFLTLLMDKPLEASIMYGMGIGCIACWFAFFVISAIEQTRKRNYKKSDRYALYQSRLDGLYDYLYSELGVPADAPCVDILYFDYVLNGEKIVPFQRTESSSKYNVREFKFYIEGENICISNDEMVYGIKLSSIKGIKRVDKKIRLPQYVAEGNRAEKFKKCNIKLGAICYIMKSYYILEFEHKNEKWGLYFPCYELSVIEELTGLKAN